MINGQKSFRIFFVYQQKTPKPHTLFVPNRLHGMKKKATTTRREKKPSCSNGRKSTWRWEVTIYDYCTDGYA